MFVIIPIGYLFEKCSRKQLLQHLTHQNHFFFFNVKVKKNLLHHLGLLHAKMEIIFQDIETFLENAKQVRPKEVP